MVEGVRVDCSERSARCSQAPLAPADRRGNDIEDLHDGSPERCDGVRRPSGDVVGDPTTLAIGHVRQRNERGRMRHGVGLLDSIANCVDIRVGRLARFVDGDPTTRSQLQAR